MCKCSVCNKEFEYGDENSPMVNNDVWKQILEFYNLTTSEKEKEDAFLKVYNLKYKTNNKGLKADISEIARHDALHTYICYECMEKALGRKLIREDLIGKNVPLNWAFEQMYFKD